MVEFVGCEAARAGNRYLKSDRLRRRPEFLRVQSGQRFGTPRLTILSAPAAAAGAPSRFGVTVSRKVGCAPVRSRVKRLLREAFRLQRAELPAGWDIVAVAKPEAANANLVALTADLLRWARAQGRRG